MATQPIEIEPIRVGRRSYGSDRIHLSPKVATPIHFFDLHNIETPVEEVTIAGVSEMFVQGWMCGDFYVELIGPRFCVSAVADDPASAARAALTKARGKADNA